ncbi:hypothetical protein HYH03_009030 [Edaphochlamys debaryana]|uniref:Maintenance of Photosystem II under High light 2 C-terminal domain-containing protein n=1 Tax=Edaphochlamys debaryana TaxID=47281 RepID=A0A835XZJ6_9CHLO|nr:hypothetical protein HYH03_009030 [Edaphochlamys debaryana]|eukprot:KAG2492614.1 hypothetical protein HYH03_009030 [Edaphochlamys debaryana]
MALIMQKACAARLVARSRTVCQAGSSASRRAILGVALLPALVYAPKSLAMILDEDDDDLVEKAKANRRARLAQQKGVTSDFLREENLRDARLERELVPVQKAVYKLAKSGSQLEAGDLSGAASTLSESWVAELGTVATALSGADEAGKLTSAIRSVQSSAAAGDASGSKRQFVALVGSLQSWAASTGLAGGLKGL